MPASLSTRSAMLLPVALASLLAVVTWGLWPQDSALWRKAAALCLSMGLGFQIAAAARARHLGRIGAVAAWLECGAFPLVMLAFLHLPSTLGWVLLAGGWSWRFLVKNLWK